MTTLSIKGCVLAAGFGTRLRPLTERFPKPLIPFAGTTPLELALLKMKKAGIREAAVNSHYLAEQIEKAVLQSPVGLNLHISKEDEILGTGGCYNPLRNWLGNSHLLVYNGDILSDIDLNGLIETHQKSGAAATMAMLPSVIPGENGFACSRQGELVAFGKQGPSGSTMRNFACAQILSPEFLDTLPKQGSFCVIQEGYLPALKNGAKLSAFVHEGFWHDLRTPWFFKQAARDFLKRVGDGDFLGVHEARRLHHLSTILVKEGEKIDLPFSIEGPALVDQNSKIEAGVKIGPFTVVERGAEIGRGSNITDSLIMENAVVQAEESVSNGIFAEGIQLRDVSSQA